MLMESSKRKCIVCDSESDSDGDSSCSTNSFKQNLCSFFVRMNFPEGMYSPFMRMRCKKTSDPPKIFQLNKHCFYEIFEYLCLKDLHSFGQTCKRMNEVAGDYFKQTHSWHRKFFKKDGIYTDIFNKHGNVRSIHTPGFNKFITCITHYCNLNDKHKYIKSHINEFESVSHIYVKCLNNKSVKYLGKLLPQLEILHINDCLVDGDFYDLILKHCKNLKAIYVEYSNINFNWLLQEYPKLEHLYLTPNQRHSQIDELREFFVRNPNVYRNFQLT